MKETQYEIDELLYLKRLKCESLHGLECKIGGLRNINPEKLKIAAWNEDYHFVVDGIDNIVSIYVADTNNCGFAGHNEVAAKFGILEEKLVGGGYLFLDDRGKLVLFNFCYGIGGIPKRVALEFAELLALELNKQGIRVDGIDIREMEVDGLYHPKRGETTSTHDIQTRHDIHMDYMQNGRHLDSFFWMEKGFERGD
jgi:hypothetical protein